MSNLTPPSLTEGDNVNLTGCEEHNHTTHGCSLHASLLNIYFRKVQEHTVSPSSPIPPPRDFSSSVAHIKDSSMFHSSAIWWSLSPPALTYPTSPKTLHPDSSTFPLSPSLISSTPTPKKTLRDVFAGKGKDEKKTSLPVLSVTRSRSFLLAESDQQKITIITTIITVVMAPIYQAEPQSSIERGVACGLDHKAFNLGWITLPTRWPQTSHLILSHPQLQIWCYYLRFIDNDTWILASSLILICPWTLGFEVSENSYGGPTMFQGCLGPVNFLILK